MRQREAASCLSQGTAAATMLPLLELLRLTDTDVADASKLGGKIPIGVNGSSCFGTVSSLSGLQRADREIRMGWWLQGVHFGRFVGRRINTVD